MVFKQLVLARPQAMMWGSKSQILQRYKTNLQNSSPSIVQPTVNKPHFNDNTMYKLPTPPGQNKYSQVFLRKSFNDVIFLHGLFNIFRLRWRWKTSWLGFETSAEILISKSLRLNKCLTRKLPLKSHWKYDLQSSGIGKTPYLGQMKSGSLVDVIARVFNCVMVNLCS
jgi:hypothetical protein